MPEACICFKERERERERESERDRETERERQRDSDKKRQTEEQETRGNTGPIPGITKGFLGNPHINTCCLGMFQVSMGGSQSATGVVVEQQRQ